MGSRRKTEEQLTQEIMKLIDQLYDTMGGEPAQTREAIQDKIASILNGTEQRVEQMRKERKEKKVAAGQKASLTKFSDEDRQKINFAMERVMVGEIPSKIAEDTGMSESAVFAWMSKRGIFTRMKVVEEIELGKSNTEIQSEGKWKIDAIQEVREELKRKAVEMEKRRREAELEEKEKRQNKEIAKQETLERRREKDRQRKAKRDAERRAIKQAEKKKKDQTFRILLAQGRPIEEIAEKMEFTTLKAVTDQERRLGILGREEIISLLSEKSDKELVDLTGIEDISVIEQIRKEEMPETMQVRKVEPIIPKQDEVTFLKLAQSLTSISKIAECLGLTEEQIRDALYDYNIFTREEVVEWLDSKSDMQIALMGNLDDHRIVERVRKEERARKLAEGMEGNVQERPIDPEVQKKREDGMFLRMAKNYEPVEKIGSVFQMNEYKVILRLRKLKLYSRAEVERMIEKGDASDVQIAGETGNANAVSRIRRKIQKRELLIRSIPEDKRVRIREKIAVGIAVSSIAYDTRINSSIIIAIQEKWKRDKDLEIPEERKKVNLNKTLIDLEGRVRTLTKTSSDYQKDNVQYLIEKILVVYERLLTQRHYAYIAYAYMKMGKDAEGIEFAEGYLNLKDNSVKGVKNRINEILEQEQDKEKPGATNDSQNMKIEWPEMGDFGG